MPADCADRRQPPQGRGLATDYCVKETALDAVRLRFDTIVLSGLVRAVDLQPGDGERALAAMRAAGARVEQPA